MARVEAPGANGALELVHHHPGRLRVRADAFRHKLELVEDIREAVLALPGVMTCTHTPRTGSLLIEYEPGVTEPDEVVFEIARTGNLERPTEETVRARRMAPATIAVRAARGLNEATMELTGSRVDLRVIVPTALAALGAYSFVYNTKEARLPRWDNLLYWSYNIFVSLHWREIEGPLRRASTLRPVPATSPGERET
jgi:Heavy metal associated domain 2